MQQHLSRAQGQRGRDLRICPSPKGQDVDMVLKTVLLLHRGLTTRQDRAARCHCAIYPTLDISTSTWHFQAAWLDPADILLVELEPTWPPGRAEHCRMNPVPRLMLPHLLCWKQTTAQVPAPLGSRLSSGAPIQTGSFILQLSEVNIPGNTIVAVYKF